MEVDLQKKYPDWKLKIIGDGSQQVELSEYIQRYELENQTELLGVQKDVSDHLNDAQIMCFPSKFEGFPRALGEAMSAGLACVGYNDCEGVVHLLRDGGVLADAEDRNDDLSVKLSAIIEDDKMRDQLGRKALEAAREYCPETVLHEWTDLINELEV